MQLSHYIDHTLLRADAQLSQIEKLCIEAKTHNFACVCVNTSYVAACRDYLKGSSTKVCCVVGFPLGAMSTPAKAEEARIAKIEGAAEIDMVIHIGALKDRRIDYVTKDIQAVVTAAGGLPVKVILETSLLDRDEKILACQAAMAAGAQFVKTSTGFGGGGATVEDVKLMKSIVGEKLEVKASGGIKDAQQALALISAGATRLGTSSGVLIVQGGRTEGGY